MPTTTRVNLQANRRGSGSARAEIQVAHSAVKAMANTLVPPRCDCGGVATAIVPGGRAVSQVQAARTTVSFRKVQFVRNRRKIPRTSRDGEGWPLCFRSSFGVVNRVLCRLADRGLG